MKYFIFIFVLFFIEINAFNTFVADIPSKKINTTNHFHSFWPDLKYEFIPAYLKENVLPLKNLFHTKFALKYGFEKSYHKRIKHGQAYRMLSDTFTIACSNTHRRMWQLITKRHQQITLVMEGDSVSSEVLKVLNIHNTINSIIERVQKIDNNWDVIQLSRCWDHCSEDKTVSKGKIFNIITSPSPLCTNAYVISEKGAKILLKRSIPYQTAVDSFMTVLQRVNAIKTYSITPRLFFQKKHKDRHLKIDSPECESRTLKYNKTNDLKIANAYKLHWYDKYTTPPKHYIKKECNEDVLKSMCTIRQKTPGIEKHEPSLLLLKKIDRLKLNGFVVWDLTENYGHTHKYVHRAIYNNFLEAASLSERPLHVCWIDPAFFNHGCSLSKLLKYQTESLLGRSLVFTSPKHLTYQFDPGLERLPVDKESFYIFHEQIPPKFSQLPKNVLRWVVRGPDASSPMIDSEDFVMRYEYPNMNDIENPIYPPMTYVAPWATNYPISTMRKQIFNKKVIVFVHFHKSAGTSFVKTALNSKIYKGWNPIQKNQWCGTCDLYNGNPYENDQIIPLWDYSLKEWKDFIQQCEQKEVNFIALEQNLPKEIDFSLATWVTILRNPYERFKSDYYFSIQNNLINQDITPEDFTVMNFGDNIHNKPNYYVRMLNGLGQNTLLNNNHLNLAKSKLKKFKSVGIISSKLSMEIFLDKLRLNKLEHTNKRKQAFKPVKYELFKNKNLLDIELFNWASDTFS